MGRNIPGSEAAITALVIGWWVYTSTGIKFEDINRYLTAACLNPPKLRKSRPFRLALQIQIEVYEHRPWLTLTLGVHIFHGNIPTVCVRRLRKSHWRNV